MFTVGYCAAFQSVGSDQTLPLIFCSAVLDPGHPASGGTVYVNQLVFYQLLKVQLLRDRVSLKGMC